MSKIEVIHLAYEALNSSGEVVKDIIQASSLNEAVEKLRRQGLFVKEIKPARKAIQATRARETALSLKTRVFFTRQLAMLLKAGSSVAPALHVLQRQMKTDHEKEVIKSLIVDLEEGLPLSEALSKFPRSFDPTYRAIVAAGEASATLGDMFQRLAGILLRNRALRNRMVGALIYPALLLNLCVGVIFTLLFFVIPRFSGMFASLGTPIPWSTELLVKTSDWLRSYWYVVIVLFGGGLTGLIMGILTARGKQILSNLQTNVPLVGKYLRRIIEARIYRTLGTLVECKVALLDALELTRQVTTNHRFQILFDNIFQSITSGESLSAVLLRSKLLDPAMAYSIHTGEECGNLGPAITYCAEVLEEENTEVIGTATKLVEPIILILMGFVVGGVAISLFLPLFDMTSAI